MIYLKPFISIITIISYFFLSLILPMLGYLVPYYRLTKVNIYGKKYSILINLTVAIILYILSVRFLILYLIFPFLTEILVYIVARLQKNGVGAFDRIIIMSLISTGIVLTYFYLDRVYLINYIDLTLNMVEKIDTSRFTELKTAIDTIQKTIGTFIFNYIFLVNMILFFVLGARTYKYWKISCYWLIPFIVIIFLNKFLNINNTIFNNVLFATKFIYIWYGVKCIYSFLDTLKVKSNLLKYMISVIVGLYYPLFAFVFGALISFDIIETKDIKI